MKLFLPVLLAGLLAPPTLVHAKKEATQVDISVQNESGEPVAQASVVVKTLKGKKKKKIGEIFQLRTSQQGTAPLPPIFDSVVLVQVIAEGYQTFGERFDVVPPQQSLTITLKPPQEQFSVTK
jgi:hypothetical protein